MQQLMLGKFQLFANLSDEKYAALKADIAKHGILVPIEVDQHGEILDGHHRVRAWAELMEEGLVLPKYARISRTFDNDDDREEHAAKLNSARRDISQEDKVRNALRWREHGWSYRRIADALAVHFETIRRWMPDESGVAFATPELPERVIGKDGKSYPATKPIHAVMSLGDAMVTDDFDWGEDEDDAGTFSLPSRVHVSHNSGENEWYTPLEYLDAARVVLGSIDLDPASSIVANRAVQAARIFTTEDDGLLQDWSGNVWLNPPYSQPLVQRFCDKLVYHVVAGDVPSAIVLVNNATETTWFHTLLSVYSALCFPKGRVRFLDPAGNPSGSPLQGQAVVYIGAAPEQFKEAFEAFGAISFRAQYHP